MAERIIQIADKQTLDKVNTTTKNTEEKVDSLKESCEKMADKTTLDAVKGIVDALDAAVKSANAKLDELKAYTGQSGGG